MAAAFRPRFRRGKAEPADPSIDSTSDAAGAADGGGDEAGDGDEGEWLAYELHEWSRESRVMLQQLLTVDGVVHSWQGTTLTVHESLEEKVDSLVEEAEEAEQAKAATSRPLGPEDDLTAFEIGDWSPELREELVERLAQAGVPHILEESAAGPDEVADGGEVVDGGCWDLWVRESDEARVDLVIEDLLARVEEQDFAELDGLEVNSLLSDLFVACDRLRRDVRDPDGVTGAMASAARIVEVRTPFGFSTPDWRSLREASGALLDLMEAQETDEDELRDLAQSLSDTLRTLI